MGTILAELFLSLLFVIVLCLLFYLIPFPNKKAKIVISIINIAIVCIIFIIPNNFLMYKIKFPIINQSIGDFISDFLSLSKSYNDLKTYSPSVNTALMENLSRLVPFLIKNCGSIIFVSIVLIVSNVVLFIINIFKKISFKMSAMSFANIILCVILALSSFSQITRSINIMGKYLAAENEKVYETYPEYKKYKLIFDVSEKFDSNSSAFKYLKKYSYLNLLKNNPVDKLEKELTNVPKYLKDLAFTNVTIIYTDDSFKFKNTTIDTFKFITLKNLIRTLGKTEIFNDISRNFTNDILKYLGQTLKEDMNKSEDANLAYARSDFNSEYGNLIDLLKYIVENNLIIKVEDGNLGLSGSISLLLDLGLEKIQELLEIIDISLVSKIKDYIGVSILEQQLNALGGDLVNIFLKGAIGKEKAYMLAAGIYTCSKIYASMDKWLADYKQTSMYETSKWFLEMKNAI